MHLPGINYSSISAVKKGYTSQIPQALVCVCVPGLPAAEEGMVRGPLCVVQVWLVDFSSIFPQFFFAKQTPLMDALLRSPARSTEIFCALSLSIYSALASGKYFYETWFKPIGLQPLPSIYNKRAKMLASAAATAHGLAIVVARAVRCFLPNAIFIIFKVSLFPTLSHCWPHKTTARDARWWRVSRWYPSARRPLRWVKIGHGDADYGWITNVGERDKLYR